MNEIKYFFYLILRLHVSVRPTTVLQFQ